jgi:hypothetical protein
MYIDPNSGGLIFQVLVLMFGVISGAVLIFSSKIKMGISKLRRSLRSKNNAEQDRLPEEEN